MDVILGFDMETDIGSWTPFDEGVKKGTPRVLNLLNDENIKATFFWVGQTAKENPEIVEKVEKDGHDNGCHSLYHETVGEPIFEIPGVYPILEEELENRLIINQRIVEEITGKRPKSFRAPRLFGGTNMIRVLESLGFTSDASYPLYYYRDRLQPYHPNIDDWTQEGDMKILEIPNFADLSRKSTDEYGRDLDQWPLFRTEGADSLLKQIDNYCQFVEEKDVPPFLCFYFHPWEFIKMPEGVISSSEGYVKPNSFIVKNCGDYAIEQFSLLIEGLKKRNADFHTCTAYAEMMSTVN